MEEKECLDRKHMENLRDIEKKYRRLIENLKDQYFVYTHDIHGVFTYISPSVTDMLGYSQEQFFAHYTTYLTDHPKNKDVVKNTELSIQGIQQPPYEVEIFHKDGRVCTLEVAEYPVFDQDGKVCSVDGIAHDITERIQGDKKREELIEKLRKALDDIKKLKKLLPICSKCKRIRDDQGYWNQIEEYFEDHVGAYVSHGICPVCEEELYGKEDWYKKGKKKAG